MPAHYTNTVIMVNSVPAKQKQICIVTESMLACVNILFKAPLALSTASQSC